MTDTVTTFDELMALYDECSSNVQPNLLIMSDGARSQIEILQGRWHRYYWKRAQSRARFLLRHNATEQWYFASEEDAK